MTRLVTLWGYAVIVGAAVAVEVTALRWHRWATLDETVSLLVRSRGAKVVLLAGWLWLGWHLFVRVDWR